MDEDFPGNLGFEETEVTASRLNDTVNIIVKRTEGTDGDISCRLWTVPFHEKKEDDPLNAIPYEDYLPEDKFVHFKRGESQKVVPIYLVNERVPKIGERTTKMTAINSQEYDEEEEEEEDHPPAFKVYID